MGMATLNIWISGIDDPCTISDRTWYVTIYECNGNVLQWCGKKYVCLPAKCGHLEVDVPPGCYYIKAVWGYTVVKPGEIYRANHFTDPAIVHAGCDVTTCVKIFAPKEHRCGLIFVLAIKDLVKQKVIKPQLANQAIRAINDILEQLPRPINEFELGHLDEIERLVQKHQRKPMIEKKVQKLTMEK